MVTRRSILPVFGAIPFTRWPVEVVPRTKETRIVFGGDMMLSRYVGRLARERRDPAWSMRDVSAMFSSADIAFANLESPFSDRGRVLDQGMVFKAEPEMIAGLELAGIDVVFASKNNGCDVRGVAGP